MLALGASAGGVEALMQVAAGLPADLPAAVFVVLHLSAETPSHLPHLLDRAGPLPAVAASDGQAIEPGRIYVAVPDYHLLLERDRMRLVRGPRENRSRPAIDPLFRTAARAFGPRVVGVVLSGALDDGSAGLRAIKRLGGVAVVQDPDDALVPSMPASALTNADVDHCVKTVEIAPLLARLAHEPIKREGGSSMPRDIDMEARLAALDQAALEARDRPGTLSAFTCPECKGPLWELRDGQMLRFRCRTGHAFTAETMLAEQAVAVEDALWMALNTLHESAQVAERLAEEARERQNPRVAERLDERAREKMRHVETLRTLLLNSNAHEVEDAEARAAGA
jgi:two-component system chemotaxis response regulator CheB